MSLLLSPAKKPGAWWVATVSGMASYVDAAAIIGAGTALVMYQDVLELTPGEVGMLSAILTLCIAAGALFGGRLGDTFGRKRVFMVTMALIVLGAGSAVFANGFEVLVVGIVLMGVGTGADLPVSLATIAEAATEKNRGKLLAFSQVLWFMGVVASTAIAMFVGELGRLGGQLLFAHVLLVAAALFVLRLTIPESSQWSTTRAEQEGNSTRVSRKGLADLFKSPLLIPFAALLVFYPLTNLAANTFGQFNTYLWVNVVGVSVSLASTITLATLPFGFLWGFLFMKVVDGPNRMKWYVVGGIAGLIAHLLPVVLGFNMVTMIVSTLALDFFIGMAFEGIMKVWTQESFPTMLRSTAQGAIIAVARVVAAALALVTPLLLESSPETLYSTLAGVLLVGLGVGYLGFRRRPRSQLGSESQTSL